MQSAADVLLDAVIDTIYLVPFLFVTYLFMEWLEHRASEGFKAAISKAGPAGPVAGAILGIIPQCGFSGVAATLYAARVVSVGTLLAVFLSTSDEMLPIFIAGNVSAQTILAVLGTKVVVGIVAGLVANALMKVLNRTHTHLHIHDLCEEAHCACECETCETCEREGCDECRPQHREAAVVGGEHASDASTAHDHADCDHASHNHDGHEHHHHSIVRSAFKHTVQVTVFVFVVVLVLNVLLALVGEDALGGFINANPVLAVFASALVGLIPNCAASVAIAQLYVDGLLGAGAMMAGLLSASGVGLLVLFRTNRHLKDNLLILVALWGIGVVCGLVVNLLGVAF